MGPWGAHRARPGSWPHMTEWFGPIGGDASGDSRGGVGMAERRRLRAHRRPGLARRREHRRWSGAARPVTCTSTAPSPGRSWAVAFRRLETSVLGPTAKAGGPNYPIGLCRWHDAENISVARSVASYRHWWEAHFSWVTEMAGLACESNATVQRPLHTRRGLAGRWGRGRR